jgi:hypothetical protein
VTEEQLQEIERKLGECETYAYLPEIEPDMRALVAEVRRLRDQNKALDPYGRGVVTRATTF